MLLYKFSTYVESFSTKVSMYNDGINVSINKNDNLSFYFRWNLKIWEYLCRFPEQKSFLHNVTLSETVDLSYV